MATRSAGTAERHLAQATDYLERVVAALGYWPGRRNPDIAAVLGLILCIEDQCEWLRALPAEGTEPAWYRLGTALAHVDAVTRSNSCYVQSFLQDILELLGRLVGSNPPLAPHSLGGLKSQLTEAARRLGSQRA